jgi:hypothetical protein
VKVTPITGHRWTTEEARRLADLASLADDLAFVVEACRRIQVLSQQDESDGLVVRALWNASLVAYARCWATGVRVGLPDGLLDQLPGDGRGFHDHLMTLRDKHIAHSVNPFEDVAIGVFVAPAATSEGAPDFGVGHLLQKLISFESEGLTHFEALATFLSAHVATMYQAQCEVVRAEAAAMGADAVLALPPVQLVTPGPTEVGVSKVRRAETQ